MPPQSGTFGNAYPATDLRFLFWKLETKGAWYAWGAFSPNSAFMGFDNCLADGKPQAGSFRITVPSRRYGWKFIKIKSRNIAFRGKSVKLIKTEFDLLELFVSYPDEVLPREFIQQQIWRDSQLYQTSRAVDVHVQRLRKKIEPEIDNPEYIVTVAGVGYKFQAG